MPCGRIHRLAAFAFVLASNILCGRATAQELFEPTVLRTLQLKFA